MDEAGKTAIPRVKIVFVHTVREWGGVERYTADLAIGLARRGHEIYAFVSPSGGLAGALAGGEVRVRPLDLGLAVGWHQAIGLLNNPLNWSDLHANPLRLRMRLALDALGSLGNIDVIHAQAVKERLWVGSYARHRGITSMWTVHAPLEPWMRVGAIGRVHSRASQRLDALIAVNRAALEDYTAFGIRPPNTTVIHNGLDIPVYAAGKRDETRASLGLRENDVAVLMPARPYTGKGTGVLLDAVAIIRESTREAAIPMRAFVAGTSRHVESFRRQAEGMGLGNSIAFLGYRDDVPDLLAAADIVTLPSFYEGLPYAISEAMAASRPVISTRVGGVPEMIDDPASGLLIEPGDAQALAASIMLLARDAGLRREMGENARKVAERRFSLDRMLDDSEAFIRSVVQTRMNGRAGR